MRRFLSLFEDFAYVGIVLCAVTAAVAILQVMEFGIADANIFTQIISLITVIVALDWRMQQRLNDMQFQQHIREALRDMGNSDAVSGMRGAHEARELGLLADRSMEGTNLQYANLANADLAYAYLQQANFAHADLTGTRLRGTDLRVADFSAAMLEHADLTHANLASAELWNSNLRGANLSNASLHLANLDEARFDTKTVLPDAISVGRTDDNEVIYDKYWSQETDMTRYTDPVHDDFWEPTWAAEGFDTFRDWDRTQYIITTPEYV